MHYLQFALMHRLKDDENVYGALEFVVTECLDENRHKKHPLVRNFKVIVRQQGGGTNHLVEFMAKSFVMSNGPVVLTEYVLKKYKLALKDKVACVKKSVSATAPC